MFLAIIQLSNGGFWTVEIPMAITNFQQMVDCAKKWMDDNNPDDELQELYIVQILHELSEDGLSEVVFSQFKKGTNHGTHIDIGFVNFNHLGFNPDLHVFICHKCGKALTEGKHEIPFCSCISGWVRPYQKYCEIKNVQ